VEISIEELTERQKYQLWRKVNNVLLKDISDYTGISHSSISRWENGKRDLPDWFQKKYDEFIREFERNRK